MLPAESPGAKELGHAGTVTRHRIAGSDWLEKRPGKHNTAKRNMFAGGAASQKLAPEIASGSRSPQDAKRFKATQPRRGGWSRRGRFERRPLSGAPSVDSGTYLTPSRSSVLLKYGLIVIWLSPSVRRPAFRAAHHVAPDFASAAPCIAPFCLFESHEHTAAGIAPMRPSARICLLGPRAQAMASSDNP